MQFVDQLGRKINLTRPVNKIVSTVPSQTELLCDLGLENALIGVTKFCEHPSHLRKEKTIIGGTKNLNIEKIKALQPDLIIANKEENTADQILELSKEFPVWVSQISNLEDALAMIQAVGTMTHSLEKAEDLIERISNEFKGLHFKRSIKCAYLIWKNPYMTVGGDTFIHAMLEHAGYENVFGDEKRYPEVNEALLKSSAAELIFLSSEPFPFKEIHIKEIQQVCPAAKIFLVDGGLFSWYGSRLLLMPKYFSNLYKLINLT